MILDYDYIKNQNKLIAIYLSRLKELNTDPEAIQQIEFVGQLKRIDAVDSVRDTQDND